MPTNTYPVPTHLYLNLKKVIWNQLTSYAYKIHSSRPASKNMEEIANLFPKLYLEKVRIVLPSITFVKAALIERSKTIKKCLSKRFWKNQIEKPWKIWHLKQEESLAKEQCTVKVTNQFSSAHLQCTMQQQVEKLIHSKNYLMLPLSKVLGSIGDDPKLSLAQF